MDKETKKHILNVLRYGTTSWHLRRKCLIEGRRRLKVGELKSGRGKFVYVYQCTRCKEWFREEEIEIDHIDEVGSFNGDWNDYVNRMYCSLDNLQRLCIKCHLVKTTANASLRFERKNKGDGK